MTYTPLFITASQVRDACGAPTSLITNDTITNFIEFVEETTQAYMNTRFTPTVKIDQLDGNGRDQIMVESQPLLKVIALKNYDSDVTVSDLEIYKSGLIKYTNTNSLNSDSSIFTPGYHSIVVKYLYAMMQNSTTTTTSSADVDAGSSVVITVASATDFADDDWVEIVGMDGNKEVSQITSTDSGTLTVDTLSYDHESGSIVTKLEAPSIMKKIMIYESAIAVAINAIGATYVFNTHYALAELTVTKGEPYPQWRESIQRNINERNRLMKMVGVRSSIMK